MEPGKLLEALNVAERLKDTTRHCYTRIHDLGETYADDKGFFSDYLKALREEIRKDTLEKLGE